MENKTSFQMNNNHCLHGIDELKAKPQSKRQWNSIPEEEKNLVVELALEYPEESPRLLATRIIDEQGIFISESSVYRILKAKGLLQEAEHRFITAADEYHRKTQFVHEMWQTDFTFYILQNNRMGLVLFLQGNYRRQY